MEFYFLRFPGFERKAILSLSVISKTADLYQILREARDWSAVYAGLIKRSTHDPSYSGHLFEVFCKHTFLTTPYLAAEFSDAWLSSETPGPIKLHLGLAKSDHGVDLVLRDRSGHFHAVQCKFRRDQSEILSWTKDSLTNFFVEGVSAQSLIIFTNASGIDAHSQKKMKGRLKVFDLADLLEMSQETMEAIAARLDGETVSVLKVKAQPRAHQETAINSVLTAFKHHPRGQLIMPCGTGKTLAALWINERLASTRTVVLVPSLVLLKQIKNAWIANQQRWRPYLCICSDKDVVVEPDDDQLNVAVSSILGKVTTKRAEIRSFLASHSDFVIYATYQSLAPLAAAAIEIGLKFDLVICDEAHRTVGVKGQVFSLVHDDGKMPSEKRLYMTATPRVVSDVVKTRLGEKKVKYLVEMSDPITFGPEFFRMSFMSAIEAGLLCDYQISVIGVSDREAHAAITDRLFVAEGLNAEDVAMNIGLERAMNSLEAKRSITYHNSVKRAKSFAERHLQRFPRIQSHHVNGKMRVAERAEKISEFSESECGILTNSRCLVEGIDIPSVDMVFFCDPRYSKLEIVQAVGRSLRLAEGKKIGHIVVPLFHLQSESIEDAVESGRFKRLVSIIRAMADHDERLVDEIRELRFGDPLKTRNHRGNSIHEHLRFFENSEIESTISQSLFSELLQRLKMPWRPYAEAREFVNTLALRNQGDWFAYCQGKSENLAPKPPDIPVDVQTSYADSGWQGWGDWLGTGNLHPRDKKFREFSKAREFAASLGLKTREDWELYSRGDRKDLQAMPEDIPRIPNHTYKKSGWRGYPHWLGVTDGSEYLKTFRNFESAREFVRSVGLGSRDEWLSFCASGKDGIALPADIPKAPGKTYENSGWSGWGDWLGTGTKASWQRVYRPFTEARAFVQGLKIRNEPDWRKYCQGLLPELPEKPEDIPANPRQVYPEHFSGYGDWLGSGNVAPSKRTFRSFESAREFARNLELKAWKEWKDYCAGKFPDLEARPDDVPSNPNKTYKDAGWRGWGNFLGYDPSGTRARGTYG